MLIERGIISRPEGFVSEAEAVPMIGPHAVIHAVDVMREKLAADTFNAVLRDARLTSLPTGECMIPEIEALRIHRWLALKEPIACFEIAEESARRTADYIIANRIPSPAAQLLKLLPPSLSAWLLMKAIRAHAWTFIGAGKFIVHDRWSFTIDRSDADDPVMPPESLFRWYAGVFSELFRLLVAVDCECRSAPSQSERTSVRRYHICRQASR